MAKTKLAAGGNEVHTTASTLVEEKAARQRKGSDSQAGKRTCWQPMGHLLASPSAFATDLSPAGRRPVNKSSSRHQASRSEGRELVCVDER